MTTLKEQPDDQRIEEFLAPLQELPPAVFRPRRQRQRPRRLMVVFVVGAALLGGGGALAALKSGDPPRKGFDPSSHAAPAFDPQSTNQIGTDLPSQLKQRCKAQRKDPSNNCGLVLAFVDGKLDPGTYSDQELQAAVAAAGYRWKPAPDPTPRAAFESWLYATNLYEQDGTIRFNRSAAARFLADAQDRSTSETADSAIDNARDLLASAPDSSEWPGEALVAADDFRSMTSQLVDAGVIAGEELDMHGIAVTVAYVLRKASVRFTTPSSSMAPSMVQVSRSNGGPRKVELVVSDLDRSAHVVKAFTLKDGGFAFSDSAGVIAGPGCSEINAREVRCQAPGIEVVSLVGGSGGDRLELGRLGPGQTGDIDGRDGADTLIGSPSDDTLQGGLAPDVILGNGGNDALLGLDGDDRLNGGSGRDTFIGLKGDDTIKARDDARDRSIDCGPGADSAEADRSDPGPRSC